MPVDSMSQRGGDVGDSCCDGDDDFNDSCCDGDDDSLPSSPSCEEGEEDASVGEDDDVVVVDGSFDVQSSSYSLAFSSSLSPLPCSSFHLQLLLVIIW